jgi:hypothetical protein
MGALDVDVPPARLTPLLPFPSSGRLRIPRFSYREAACVLSPNPHPPFPPCFTSPVKSIRPGSLMLRSSLLFAHLVPLTPSSVIYSPPRRLIFSITFSNYPPLAQRVRPLQLALDKSSLQSGLALVIESRLDRPTTADLVDPTSWGPSNAMAAAPSSGSDDFTESRG